MNLKKVVSGNALYMLVRVLLSAVITFSLYRFLLQNLGAERLGVWALIIATTSIGNIGSLGLGGGLVKFIAAYEARNDVARMNALLHTAVISIAVVMCGVATVLYLFRESILTTVIPARLVPLAMSVFPLALLGLWVGMVAMTYQSFLEGRQQFAITSTVVTIGIVVHALCAFTLVPTNGLHGVVIANVISSAIVLVGMMLAVRLSSIDVKVLPRRWSSREFKQAFAYGASFQVIAIATMLFDPITKFLMGRFGSISGLGYYEMASRLVLVIRQLLISMNSVIVPAVSNVAELSIHRVHSMYRRNLDTILIVSSVLLLAPAALAPLVSEVWLGQSQELFIFSTIALSLGWFINTLSGPSYFFFLGQGDLTWVTISHVAIAIVNLVLGIGMGILWGTQGIVLAFVVALGVGSSVTIIAYSRSSHLQLNDLFDKASILVIINSVVIVLASNLAQNYVRSWFPPTACLLMFGALFAFASVVNVSFHPASKDLLRLTREMLEKKPTLQ